MPLARATGIGSTFDCADHSKSVCFFDSAIISSPLIVRGSVSVGIASSVSLCLCGYLSFFLCVSLPQHRVALRLELVPRLPLRQPVRLRDAVADREEDFQVL